MTKLLFLLIVLLFEVYAQSGWQSDIVYFDEGEKLVYIKDSEGNRIPDFSYAGYRNGEQPIPEIPVVKTIQPIDGDNTIHIENALFEVALNPKDENGFRGALLLEAGVYEVQGIINLQFDGVILRGMDDGEDSTSNTILWATGNLPAKRSVIIAGGGYDSGWSEFVSGTFKNIIDDTVFVGEKSFTVSSTFWYEVGDNIIIEHPCTAEWLEAIDYGGTHSDEAGAEPGVDIPWEQGSLPIRYNRYITAINGNKITVDAPVYNHLIKNLAQSVIYKYSRQNLLTNIGIENLRIDIQTNGVPDENHAWNAIDLFNIEDAWIKNCTFLHFGLSGVRTKSATRVTVENCQALDPVATIEGGNMYNFNVSASSQLIIFKNCRASNGRHHYGSNGKSTTSGIVFVDCTSEGAYTSSEGHRRWSQALLFDNLKELDGPRLGLNKRLLGLYNRGYYGTSHGWAVAHSVAWNCDVNDGYLIVQKAPTAQNYAIGCFGKQIRGDKPYSSFDEPEGYIEGNNIPDLKPRSIYYAQLDQRLRIIDSIDPDITTANMKDFKLDQNFPNPFNPSTEIKYHVGNNSGLAVDVNLAVYNILGQQVKTLVSAKQNAGNYSVKWNADNFPSGIYYYKIVAGEFSYTRKMMLLR
ncbi:MAG: T9SS C-terminal target domain-containing protein [Calditrichaeota bacterium]|nr:MAG: T9SS C-terminal target domain-containing protein [Calditrichota bacterium]MBL1205592.1 T9SS C-terminal target domain-containing protein [Calditrichota bacterium]NOG45421.1 T9SS type A sorting domain-containing protein [Calditrichota bacterium]